MTLADFNNEINEINNWAINTNCYDIAIFKMWIKFEKYISNIFVDYCIGKPSESGYCPKNIINFQNDDLLNRILKNKNTNVVDYKEKIENISKYIFEDNPFDLILNDANYYNVYNNLFVIRNYIAHESGYAKTKYINTICGGSIDKFIEPKEFLLRKMKNNKITHYSFYKDSLLEMAKLITDGKI